MKEYILIFILLVISGCEKAGVPRKFILPEGYTGVVMIEYGILDALVLDVQDGYYIISVPSNGLVQTSSKLIGGSSPPDRFYYLRNGA